MAQKQNAIKGFKLAHFNVRSLLPKKDSIELWMNGHNFDIVTFSETWLDPRTPDTLLGFNDYDSYRLDRARKSKGGGLLTLVKRGEDTLVAEQLQLNVSNDNAEIQVLNIKPGKIRKMTLLNCYRPPAGATDAFVNHICQILDEIEGIDEREIYICGDMNIPYNQTNTIGYRKLKMLENKYNLTQVVKTPTRCTARTSSILDLIFTNSNCLSMSATDEVNISDHEPVYIIRKKRNVKPKRVTFECRDFRSFNDEAFQDDLKRYDWSGFYRENDVDSLWDELRNVIRSINV